MKVKHTGSKTDAEQSGAEQSRAEAAPWPLVRERTIPTGRPPLVDEI
jgi:hypothetical protein